MQTWSFISWFKDDLLPKDRILNCLAWWIRLFKNWLLRSPISGFTFQRPQRAYNGCLITFSSTPLCLCNFGEVPGCGYLTTPRTPQTAILVLSTSPWGSDLVQGKKGAGEGNAFSFPRPHTKPNLQQLSKYSFSDSKGGPHLHTTKKWCQGENLKGRLSTEKRLKGPNKNHTGPHLLSKCPKARCVWNSKFLTFWKGKMYLLLSVERRWALWTLTQ